MCFFDIYLHPYLEEDAEFQMAYDTAMMKKNVPGFQLRFYRFSPPAVTVGYLQKNHRNSNWPEDLQVVKRPTGGRAVFHYDEITYAVSCGEDILEKKYSIIEFYDLVAGALVAGLKKIGIDAAIHRRNQGRRYGGKVSCFSSISIAEIVVDGKKLIGSAQCRREGHILQHGSIPLRINQVLENELFGFTDAATAERTSLYRLIKPDACSPEKIIDCLAGGFTEILGGRLIDIEFPRMSGIRQINLIL